MAIQITVMSIDFDSFEEPVTKIFSKEEVTIGRTDDNDLVLDRQEVSGLHAEITVETNGTGEPTLFVCDLGSSNGTLLERDLIPANKRTKVLPNQRIIIGSYLLKPNFIPHVAVDTNVTTAEPEPVRPKSSEGSMRASPTAITPKDQPRPEVISALAQPSLTAVPASQPKVEEEAPAAKRGLFGSSFTPQPDPNFSKAVDRALEGAASDDRAPTAVMSTFSAMEKQVEASEAKTNDPVSAVLGAAEITLTLEEDSIFDLHFEAQALHPISGFVRHKGTPLSGVRIDGGEAGTAETDYQGQFSLSALAEGTAYSLAFAKPGFAFEPGKIVGVVESPLNISVSAFALYQIEGTVTRKGAAVEAVEVSAGALGTTQSDSNGHFHFSDIREGTGYSLRLQKPGMIFEPSEFKGTLTESAKCVVTAKKLLTIAGSIVHKGQPIAGVEVECAGIGKTLTDASGKYSFEGVPEGVQYTITAKKDGFVFGTGSRK